jgi:hypothetical protein
MPEAKPHSPSLLKAGIIGIGIFAAMFFFVTAMNTGDLLWFWSKFDEVPVNIIVHCYGTDVEVQLGASSFEAVTKAVNTSLSGSKRWDDISMSEETYHEYQTNPSMMVLELRYDPPVSIHSSYAFFKNVNWLVIPLDGRHAETNAVFGRTGGFINAGSYHVESLTSIISAFQEYGICAKP